MGGQKDEEAGKDEQTETKEKRDDKELDKAMENAGNYCLTLLINGQENRDGGGLWFLAKIISFH